MFTDQPNVIAREELADAAQTHGADGIGVRVFDRMRQLFCGMHGHDNLLQFEQHRMFLRCVSCGYESPGWEIADTPPAISARAASRQAALIRPSIVDERRIA